MIHGLCVGGGLEIAATCDLRVCGASSRFGVPIKRLGLVVDYPELDGLIQLVGPANALEILLDGGLLGAEAARQKCLVNRVVPDDRVEAETRALAASIAEGAPLVARWHKKFTWRLMEDRPLTAEEADEPYHCFGTEDFVAGSKAFLAKTKPVFKGR
jgi:enoyl-CoA hydratase/carnithine racemase